MGTATAQCHRALLRLGTAGRLFSLPHTFLAARYCIIILAVVLVAGCRFESTKPAIEHGQAVQLSGTYDCSPFSPLPAQYGLTVTIGSSVSDEDHAYKVAITPQSRNAYFDAFWARSYELRFRKLYDDVYMAQLSDDGSNSYVYVNFVGQFMGIYLMLNPRDKGESVVAERSFWERVGELSRRASVESRNVHMNLLDRSAAVYPAVRSSVLSGHAEDIRRFLHVDAPGLYTPLMRCHEAGHDGDTAPGQLGISVSLPADQQSTILLKR